MNVVRDDIPHLPEVAGFHPAPRNTQRVTRAADHGYGAGKALPMNVGRDDSPHIPEMAGCPLQGASQPSRTT